MAKFHLQCTYIEIKVPKIEILSEILEEKDIDNQMFTILGLEEPLFRLKYSDFSCVIALYFVSIFYDHPVCQLSLIPLVSMFEGVAVDFSKIYTVQCRNLSGTTWNS